MLGLINRSIQCFLRDTYGEGAWLAIARAAQLSFDSFEPLLIYDDALTDQVIEAAAHKLSRSRETVLEDLGIYLVSHPNLEALRRLLRFGGVTFVDFLHSLEDLAEHGRLGLPDLHLPDIELVDQGKGEFLLFVPRMVSGIGHVIVGMLRAMADDYGVLAVLDHAGRDGHRELVAVHLLDQAFSSGRGFQLAMPKI